MSKQKILLTALVTLILTVVIVATINVGLSIFLEAPQYDKYCPNINTQATCESNGGNWTTSQQMVVPDSYGNTKPIQVGNNYCEYDYTTCQKNLEDANKHYNDVRFYTFAGSGVILALIGLFITFPLIQFTGIISSLVLLGEGIIFNFSNKIAVFITLIIVLIIVGVGAFIVLKRNK